jgi:hypothetical protein
LWPNDNTSSEERLYIDEGIIPESIFDSSKISFKLDISPKALGIFPLNRFCPASKYSREVRFIIELGMFPVRLFCKITSLVRLDNEYNCIGISPTSMVLLKYSQSRVEQCDKLLGISPPKELFESPNLRNLNNLPISFGMPPPI